MLVQVEHLWLQLQCQGSHLHQCAQMIYNQTVSAGLVPAFLSYHFFVNSAHFTCKRAEIQGGNIQGNYPATVFSPGVSYQQPQVLPPHFPCCNYLYYCRTLPGGRGLFFLNSYQFNQAAAAGCSEWQSKISVCLSLKWLRAAQMLFVFQMLVNERLTNRFRVSFGGKCISKTKSMHWKSDFSTPIIKSSLLFDLHSKNICSSSPSTHKKCIFHTDKSRKKGKSILKPFSTLASRSGSASLKVMHCDKNSSALASIWS